MTSKIYRSAQGKMVDIGALILQNEKTRAVGNMNVNARGDRLDSANRVIDPKNKQVQRQYQRQTNVSGDIPVQDGEQQVYGQQSDLTPDPIEPEIETGPRPVSAPIVQEVPVVNAQTAEPVEEEIPAHGGGLAGAIARSRAIKQELEKTPRQRAQEAGVKKI